MKPKKLIGIITPAIISIIMFNSCSTIPKGVTAVSPFYKEKYLGKWYEIARIDFRFERNLNNTTADYSVNDDGSIKVENRGFNYETKQWKYAAGKAKFAGDQNVAMLKVSFFGPFYSGYNVIALDDEYKYALVTGDKLKYLWILSRETEIPEDVKQNYLKTAESFGFDVSLLIWVEHDKAGNSDS
ncbi:MAG: lipocalin family protein [Bacteroidales bacterium]|nr:lipocalin family protein [Bacteroidales bacterium]